jgi:hypothetical protein
MRFLGTRKTTERLAQHSFLPTLQFPVQPVLRYIQHHDQIVHLDGIDIYFLNERDNVKYRNVTTPADVEAIFNNVTPKGGTPTGSRLHAILRPYQRELESKGEENVKPLNIIVIHGRAGDGRCGVGDPLRSTQTRQVGCPCLASRDLVLLGRRGRAGEGDAGGSG